jgi:alpha-1,3-mannosyl-glycoprotein beta-1,2-N-acetylglucosaminyltransferase
MKLILTFGITTFNQVFLEPSTWYPLPKIPIARVIILEEDLEIASDFFSYFLAVAPLLDKDPSLLAASAWNDNGMTERVLDPATIYRSDFFPGLGWMLTRQVWAELRPKWPEAYWDDWLREPEQRKGRHFLRPEICRTYHFGRVGTSGGQFADLWERMQLNEQWIDFKSLDLSYLSSEAAYDRWIFGEIAKARPTTLMALLEMERNGTYDVENRNKEVFMLLYESPSDSFGDIAQALGLFADLKAGVLRTAYKGVVTVRVSGKRVHVVPRTVL